MHIPAVMTDPNPQPGVSPAVTAAVTIDSVGFNYGDRVALHNVSLRIEPGEIFGLLGPNGGGKTTLFKILSTLELPNSGNAEVFGHSLRTESHYGRALMGVVFQAPSLDKKLTVAENMMHQGHLYGLSGEILQQRIAGALETVRLTSRAGERVDKLSGGMQRRVEVAKAMLHEPRLLLLDEPSTGLDPSSRYDLWQHLVSLKAEKGITCLLTTHLMEEAEQCDRVAIIDRGQIVAMGTPDELKNQIGGEVLSVRSANPEELRDQLMKEFVVRPGVLGQTVRMETSKYPNMTGAQLLLRVTELFPHLVDSVRLGKATLDDVFIHVTGHRFDDSTEVGPRG